VGSVFPTAGITDATTNVRITGTGFKTGATVTIGDAATNVSVSNTMIIATAPPHAEGTVDVVVTNPGGESARLAGGYRYARLSVTSVAPSSGIIGKWLKVVGFGLVAGTKITFDGLQASIAGASGISLFALAPAHAAGPVDVVVTNPNGSSSTLAGGFTYQDVTVTASAAVVTAGAPVTVSWVAPPGQSDGDWVGLFKAGETLERWFVYTGGLVSGTRTLTVPADPGQYEFRYLVDDGYDVAARSGTVTVVAAAVR
jgi:hypothetical protein